MDRTWFDRFEAERRAGNITRAERDVLRAIGRLIELGQAVPTEAQIAHEAHCSRRTVQRAKVRARELGLLQWDRRFAGGRGLRRELSCSYRATVPTRPVARRERQPGRLRVKEEVMLRRSVQAQLAALEPITPALEALWAARRARLGSGNLVAIR